MGFFGCGAIPKVNFEYVTHALLNTFRKINK